MQPAPPGQGSSVRPRGARAGVLPLRLPAFVLGGPGYQLTLAAWRDRLLGALSREAERRRLFLWLPVMMGAGILLYFAADREPVLWAPLTGFVAAGAGAFALRRRRLAPLVCFGCAAAFAGFAAAAWRTATVAAPMLDRPRIGQVTGFVESVEARDVGARLVILMTGLAGVEPERWPRRVRVNVRAGTVSPGDHIAAVARLLPPPTSGETTIRSS